MKIFLILSIFVFVSMQQNMLVTKEYTDYLRKHVSWEVVDYEENIFRGWTIEEAKVLTGLKDSSEPINFPSVEPLQNLPTSINWSGAPCEHEVRNQGNCESSWAFSTAGMLTDRCCLNKEDHGWLSPQELVSCDEGSDACDSGTCASAMTYIQKNNGLVDDACFPYKARDLPCPEKCVYGGNWHNSHVCGCNQVLVADSCEKIKTALKDGPISLGFGVCRSFFIYKRGYYVCDCGESYVGLHTALGVGYGETEQRQLYLHAKNSWGTGWGITGFFDILCSTCGIGGKFPKGNVYCNSFK